MRKRRRNNLGLIALEPRWMFDGAAVADAAHAVPDAAAKALIPDAPAPVEVRAADPAQDGGRKEVVFVDTALANAPALEAGIKAGIEVVEIGGGQDGLAQIAQWADSHNGYDSITIMALGAEGGLQLGSHAVTDADLSSAATKAEMAEIGSALKAGGDIIIDASSVGRGTDGRQLVNDMASATGATVGAFSEGTNGWALDAASDTMLVQAADPSLDGGKT
ncbi:MAG: DUF4347 domain-containing protein, partial [Magnetospirillum sp.]|nr:DUF4347 domain-containing protein [Magnetospirillum sp.]